MLDASGEVVRTAISSGVLKVEILSSSKESYAKNLYDVYHNLRVTTTSGDETYGCLSVTSQA